jgi:hypothetical protein
MNQIDQDRSFGLKGTSERQPGMKFREAHDSRSAVDKLLAAVSSSGSFAFMMHGPFLVIASSLRAVFGLDEHSSFFRPEENLLVFV